MSLLFQPMPLQTRVAAFDDGNFVFEVKLDGFRALAVIEHGRAQMVSRNGHRFTSFTDLASDIAVAIRDKQTVLDGEIVCLDKKGRPQFRDLLFHRGIPCFFAFDILFYNGKDWRSEPLMDRKQELRRLLSKVPADSRLHYVGHIDGTGTALFERVCELDLEGVVAKYRSGQYITDRENSTWFKIRNRKCSQMAGREKLFDRERHREPVPGWHSCVLACVELEEAS